MKGNSPGRSVFWKTGKLEIIRFCHGVFTLEYEGLEVMPQGTFEAVHRYAMSEFLDTTTFTIP